MTGVTLRRAVALALAWTVAIANLGCVCADEISLGVKTGGTTVHPGSNAHDCCPAGESHPASHQPGSACAHCDRLQPSLGSERGLAQLPTGHATVLAVDVAAPTIPPQSVSSLHTRTAVLDPPRVPFLAHVVLQL